MYVNFRGEGAFRSILFSSLSIFTVITPAAAAEAVEEIVVTATTHEQSLRTAPASISVVDRQELELRFSDDLTDALTAEQGVTVTAVGQTRKGISLRGMPVEHTLYLLDGRRISSTNGVVAHSDFELSWLPPSAIERIEVLRGPMSSLYGSDALGGVVNVITRVPSQEFSGEVTADGTVLERGGDGASYKFGGYFAGPIIKDKLSFTLAGQLFDRANLPTKEDEGISEVEGRESLAGRASLIWTPVDGQRVDLVYSRSEDDRDRDTARYSNHDDISREQIALSYNGAWDWGDVKFNAYQSSAERDNERTNGTTPTRSQGLEDNVVDGHVSLKVMEGNRITFGGQLREEKLFDDVASASGVTTVQHNSVFVQDEFNLVDKLSLVGGIRFDHHDVYGWESSPRLYAVYEVTDNLVLKGGYGEGFRAPSLTELSAEFQVLAAGGRFWVFGNPDLDPERSKSWEVSVQYDQENWAISATLFQNDLENLVQSVCVSDCGVRGREIRYYQNVDAARIKGVEVSLTVRLTDDLQLDGNYTYLDAEDRGTGDPLESRPEHSGNISLNWQFMDQGNLRFRSEFVGKQYDSSGEYTPTYSLHHLDFVMPLREGLLVRAGIENIFDERLADKSDLFGLAEPGRQYRLGVTARF